MTIVAFRTDPDETAWRAHANCLGVDPDLFYPRRNHGGGTDTRQAKAVCAGCAVRQQCLDYAMTHKIEHGVWGGTSNLQRKRMRRQARGAA